MKYLKLFEGFESNRISSILSFLNKKLNRNNYDKFLKDLKILSKKYDFPLSTLNDEEIDYVVVNKALQIKGEAMNPSGIYAIKYWFSIEKGYLCQTGVGNKDMNFREFEKIEQGTLNSEHIKYLYDRYKLTGVITPCNFKNLVDGDKIVMVCNDSFNGNSESLVYGEIYIDRNDGEYYLFQNSFEGCYPNDGYMLPGYEYSWSLGSLNGENGDHCMINKIIPDDKPLRLKDSNKEEEKESVWDFNLPLYNNHPINLEIWQHKYKETLSLAKDANFAIILYLDDVLVKDLSTEEISKERKESRKDSLALIKNEDIKKENIKRYLEKLFDRLGIQKDKQELKNLNTIVKSAIVGKYFLLSTYSSYFISKLIDFITSLYKVMSKYDEQYYFSNLVEIFKKIKSKSLEENSNYSTNIKYLKSLNRNKIEINNVNKMNDILEIILRIGKSVSDEFSDREINTIEDLKSVQLQLRLISDLSQDDIFKLSSFPYNILDSLRMSKQDVEYYINRVTYNDDNFQSDIKKLNNLEKLINKDFLKK